MKVRRQRSAARAAAGAAVVLFCGGGRSPCYGEVERGRRKGGWGLPEIGRAHV